MNYYNRDLTYQNNIPNLKLAQAYIPYQKYQNLFTVEEALYKGTIFKDLYRPYKRK